MLSRRNWTLYFAFLSMSSLGDAVADCLVASLLAFSMIVLPACSSKPVEEPRVKAIDWYEVGHRSGSSGRPIDPDLHLQGTPHDAYMNGWNEGVSEYCTARTGLDVGRSGQAYQKVCPSYLEKKFLDGYKTGEQIRSLEQRNLEISARIESLSQDVEREKGQNRLASPLEAQLKELKKEHSSLSNEILKAEQTVDSSNQTH